MLVTLRAIFGAMFAFTGTVVLGIALLAILVLHQIVWRSGRVREGLGNLRKADPVEAEILAAEAA